MNEAVVHYKSESHQMTVKVANTKVKVVNMKVEVVDIQVKVVNTKVKVIIVPKSDSEWSIHINRIQYESKSSQIRR